MNYLGIDYGEVKVGVAIATGPLAEPLTTASTQNTIREIGTLITEMKIEEVIVGDCPGEFLQSLQSLGLPVHQVYKTLSSHDARESLMHTTRKKRRELEHAVSAAIILQNWLDVNATH